MFLPIGWKLERLNQSLPIFFSSTIAAALRCYEKKIKSFDFNGGVKFDFKDSVKNNGTKYVLNFDDSCGENCISTTIVHTATAERRR